MRFLRTKKPDGRLPASLLSKPLLDEFYAWLLRSENGLHGHARSVETARKIVSVVQLAWEWAENSERWPGEIPRPRRIEMRTTPVQEVHAPTWAEMDACVLACRNWHRQLVIFLRYSGLRVGETMLLEWSDIDLDKGLLTIRPEISKTGVGRTIPMSPYLVEEIVTWGAHEGYVVPSGRRKGERERQARPRDICAAWARAKVRENVWRRRPDHAFRRGIKSGLLALRAHPDAIDYLQGHSLGNGSSRSRYIDSAQLPLAETVRLIPKIGRIGSQR